MVVSKKSAAAGKAKVKPNNSAVARVVTRKSAENGSMVGINKIVTRAAARPDKVLHAPTNGHPPYDRPDSGGHGIARPAMRQHALRSSRKAQPEEEDLWAQCNKCEKWRRLHESQREELLPDVWLCSMNIHDPQHNSCSAPEEDLSAHRDKAYPQKRPYEPTASPAERAQDRQLRERLILWTKRVRHLQKAANKMPAAEGSRDKDLEEHWVRCQNPCCGKWRSLPPNVDVSRIIRRDKPWYCVMNTWDDCLASCAAAQEHGNVFADDGHVVVQHPVDDGPSTSETDDSSNPDTEEPYHPFAFDGAEEEDDGDVSDDFSD